MVKGGRPRKAPTTAVGGDGCAGGAAAAPRLRGRPPRPPPVAADSAMQAAVRARLRNMLVDSVSDICRTVFPQDRSWVGQPNQVQVELLMANHVLLADVLGITPDAPDTQLEPEDTPDLEALRARLKQLPKATLEALCPAVFPSPNHSWRGLLREPLEKHLMTKPTELMLALAVRETTAGGGLARGRPLRRRWPAAAPPPPPPPPPAPLPAGKPLPAELTRALAASETTAGAGSAALRTDLPPRMPPPPPPPPPPPLPPPLLAAPPCFHTPITSGVVF